MEGGQGPRSDPQRWEWERESSLRPVWWLLVSVLLTWIRAPGFPGPSAGGHGPLCRDQETSVFQIYSLSLLRPLPSFLYLLSKRLWLRNPNTSFWPAPGFSHSNSGAHVWGGKSRVGSKTHRLLGCGEGLWGPPAPLGRVRPAPARGSAPPPPTHVTSGPASARPPPSALRSPPARR